jgi:ADP-ribosylglycohydrolase
MNAAEFHDKVLGCWLGKNVGGTLGAPFEWKRQVNDVSFYTQDLTGDPAPNDDLDLQLAWLIALEEKGLDVTAHRLAEYWLMYVTPHWSEYGICKANLRAGLAPPLSGSFGNVYKDSCGAYIRSEIWACIAPGDPRAAARYAYEDAIVDHGDGEGTHAEVFCAALEAAAFVEPDLHALIAIALSYIPEGCGVARCVRSLVAWHGEGKTWREARDLVLEHYRGMAAPWCADAMSEEEKRKGLADGPLGWDVPSNIGITVLGLLWGAGDFAKTQTICVNCGEDTDCTAATAGSIFGIIHGAAGIPEAWIKPIGRKIKTACLNLGELGFYGAQVPQDVDELTDRVLRVQQRVQLQTTWPKLRVTADGPTDLSALDRASLAAGKFRSELYANHGRAVYRFDFFRASVDYGPGGPTTRGAATPEGKVVRVTLDNTYKQQRPIHMRCHVPPGLSVSPTDAAGISLVWGQGGDAFVVDLTFRLNGPATAPSYRAVVELTSPGHAAVMHVPIVLLNTGIS